MHRILYAKYEKAYLNKAVTKQFKHLNTKERKKPMSLLKKFEDLFDSTLGMWFNNPVDLEWKEWKRIVSDSSVTFGT